MRGRDGADRQSASRRRSRSAAGWLRRRGSPRCARTPANHCGSRNRASAWLGPATAAAAAAQPQVQRQDAHRRGSPTYGGTNALVTNGREAWCVLAAGVASRFECAALKRSTRHATPDSERLGRGGRAGRLGSGAVAVRTFAFGEYSKLTHAGRASHSRAHVSAESTSRALPPASASPSPGRLPGSSSYPAGHGVAPGIRSVRVRACCPAPHRSEHADHGCQSDMGGHEMPPAQIACAHARMSTSWRASCRQ